MAIRSALGSVGRPAPQTSKATRIPAPIAGMDARTILSGGNPLNSIYSINMLPDAYGLRVRKGYREWQIELENGSPEGVGTIIPFGGVDDDSSNDRLFAVTNEGIWNVTADAGTPSLVVDFSDPGNGGDTSPEAGYGVYTHYTTDADEELLFYADSRNGLFQYSESTELWTRPAGITGPTIADIDFVTSHKEQLWFIERDQSKAWYLPIGAISGAASEFFFGSKFKHGGNLAGLFSWSVDGGEGLDDYFVAVSRSGDVLPYIGTDPASADTWQASGQYFIGAVPNGRRFGSEYGGNLNLLSAYGLISMDDLVRGVDGKDINSNTETIKIATLIRQEMAEYRNTQGWMIKTIPSQGSLLIAQPQRSDDQYFQYVMNTTTTGWGLWRTVPINCFDEWNGKVYFGTKDSRVMVMDVGADNITIAPPPMGELNGVPIVFSVLTTFQDYGEPALFKRAVYCRPDFLTSQKPNITIKFRYDYDLAEVVNTAGTAAIGPSLWDIGLWDDAIWDSTALEGKNILVGGSGIGRTIAVAMKGNSRVETTLLSFDVTWNGGGPT
jgi:hypothetical protein